MKKKIIIFINSLFGGAEKNTITMGKVFRSMGLSVKFYIVERPGNGEGQVQNLLNDDFEYKIIPWHYLIARMFLVILKERPTYVFSSLFQLNIKLCEIKKRCPFFKLIIRNNFYTSGLDDWCFNKVKSLYKYADAIILQTDEMVEDMKKIGVENISHVIPNPIDEECIEKCTQAPNPFYGIMGKIIVAVGRFAEQKDYKTLIRAFNLAIIKNSDLTLYIVGQNDGVYETYYNEIRRMIIDLNLTDKVVCTGFKENPYVYIKNADCFVLSSSHEGYPNVINEALFCGTPIAAFNCVPVIGRIVIDGEYGYVVEEHTPEALSEAILKTLEMNRYNCKVNRDSKTQLAELVLRL